MSLQRESSSTAAAGMIGELQHPHLVPCELQRTSIFERVTSDTSGSIFKQQTSATFLCRVVHVATKGFLYHDSVAFGASLASVVIAAGLLFLVSRCLTSRFASRPQVPLSTATMSAFIQFLFDGGESTRLVPLKMLYLIHYMAFSTQTFLPMYFDTKEGYTKFQIGVLLAIPCVCSIIGPVVWGAASDIFQNQKLVHIICLVSAALLMFVLKYVESFEVMCIMFFIANFQTQPTWSLLDQVAMEMLDRIGGDYGKQRLYGAVGYGIGGYMAGVIAAAVGIAWCFNMVVALSCISLYLLMYHIPSFQRTKPKMEFFQSLSHILQQRDVLLLFVLVLVIGIIAQLIDSFLFLYLFNLSGNNSTLVGVVIAVETTSELPLFFHANRIIDRLGTPRCIFMGVAAYAIRLLAYILVENPWTILPVEAMHGITFGLVWAAFTNYVYQSAPEGTEGTMIGLLAAVQKGVGGGIGTLIGGWIYQNHGGRVMWAIALFGVLPVALLIAIAFSFLAKSHRLAKSVDFEDQPIKRRTPSYGAIHHLGSSQHLDTLG